MCPRRSNIGSDLSATRAVVVVLLSLVGSGVAAGENPTGHQRMVALLAKISIQAPVDNPFLGEAGARDVRAKLAALPGDASATERAQLHRELGRHLLRLGREQQALAQYLEALETLRRQERVSRRDVVDTLFGIGVTYMRIGETKNCAQRHTSESCIMPIRGGGVHIEKGPSRNAIRYLTDVLRNTSSRSIAYVRARWLLNIAYMTVGDYPDKVPAEFVIPPETFDSDQPFPRFRDVAPDLGLNSFDLSGGAVAGDFDADGFLDIVVSTSDTAGQMRYYRNNGDGTFTERTEEAGLIGLLGGLNMIQADYDNDGDTDLFVLRGGWYRRWGRHPNSLLRNNGKGTFTDVTFEAGLGRVHYPTQTASWGDYDNDGDLDLYVGNEDEGRKGFRPPCQLFRNNGDGSFVDVAKKAGVENHRFAKGVIWGDYDGDGHADLYVSNAGDDNRLYHNNGDGSFEDVAASAGVSGPKYSFPTWFWDFDNDGALDLFVAAYGDDRFFPDVSMVAASYLGIDPDPARARLYRGDGKGGFRDVAVEQNLRRVTLPMGANFGDLDNDGFLDFYLGTGYPLYEGLMPNVMYHNLAGERFADVTTDGGFGHLQKGHGVVFADLDNDGDQDVFEQMGGAYPGDGFGNVLFENPGFGGHWIKLQLVGTRSNRSAIGARIRIDLLDGDEKRTIYKYVNSGGSFGGNPLRQEIGLGQAGKIDRLEIRWPASGAIQLFRDVQVDELYRVVEGKNALQRLSLKRTKAVVEDP